jgi:glycosyltransferase involved in cell wall biosynthesis
LSEKRVMVFTGQVLPLSQTFIAAHCAHLRRYAPTLVGLTQDRGITEFNHPSVILNAAGHKPSLLRRAEFNLGFSRRMARLITELKPALIHAHFADNAALILPYARAAGIPLIVTLHGYDVAIRMPPLRLRTQIIRSRRKAVAAEASVVLAVSEYLRDRAVEHGFANANLKVHYLGIPIPEAPCVSARKKPLRIVYAGRLFEKKGIDKVIAAFAETRRTLPDAELHVVGDGPLRPLVESAKAEIGGIASYGALPHAKLLELLKDGRIFTMPSRDAKNGDYEGFGLVLLEAQALGLPAVTSNVTGTREAVQDGVTGFCIDPNDHLALARRYTELLSDPDRCDEMGRAAIKWVRGNFDIVRRTEMLERLYDDVLQQTSSSLVK